MFVPIIRTLVFAVPMFCYAMFASERVAPWQAWLDRFTIFFIVIYLVMALLELMTMASRKRWLRPRR